jgi:hypothetical protein
MKIALNVRTASTSRIAAFALVVSLLFPPLSVTAPAFAAQELPSAPAPRLQLQGTLASMNVAPSKLDNGPAQESVPPASALKMVILEGEDVSNNIKERTAREPIVQVEDENHKPVAGAAVLFSIDSGGGHAGATFLNGAKTFSGQTDANGRIVARGFHPNGHTGQFHINVTATKGPLTTRTSIRQTNMAAASSGAATSTIAGFVATHATLLSIVVAAAVVGGVVAGAVVNVPSSPTIITTGTGTVGVPQVVGGVHFGVRK